MIRVRLFMIAGLSLSLGKTKQLFTAQALGIVGNKASYSSDLGSTVIIPIPQLRSTIYRAVLIEGHSPQDSEIITDVIMFAELRGNNQGIVKLISGALKSFSECSDIVRVYDTPVSTKLDGQYRQGMIVMSESVQIAIEKAKTTGVGIVGASGYASATGALGMWARMIAQQGLIGIVCNQCQEYVAPYGSYEPIFGTNPIAIGIPTAGRVQVLDMATSSSAYFGLVTASEEGQSIALDVAYDDKGRPTTDPKEAMRGALRAFDRSYKGSNLALMIELLSGAWTGAAMTDKENSKNWGSLVLAIDPKVLGCTLEEFQANAEVMCQRVKHAKVLHSKSEGEVIFLPGERGDALEQQNIANGNIRLSSKIFSKLEQFIADGGAISGHKDISPP